MRKLKLPNYKTVNECAEEWGVSKRRVQIYCSEGRIEGLIKIGQSWMIPIDAKKPPEKERRN